MSLRVLNPTSPGRRNTILATIDSTTRSNPEKCLTNGLVGTFGKHNGIICRFRINGHKRIHRIIDFERKKIYEPGKVSSIEYAPCRNSCIAKIHYRDGRKAYILAPKCIRVGNIIISGFRVPLVNGNFIPIWNIPLGVNLHNIECKHGAGGQLARSRGRYSQLVYRIHGYVSLRIPSGKIRIVSHLCWATVGQVGNTDQCNRKKRKSGTLSLDRLAT
jgi:large subunit ribosomal protein L2